MKSKNNLKNFICIFMSITLMISLVSCGNKNKEIIANISSGELFELNLDSYNTNNVVQVQTEKTEWVPLAKATTYINNGFRSNFDRLFGINKVTVVEDDEIRDSKQGCIYTISDNEQEIQSSNTTLRDAIRNKEFNNKINEPDTIEDLGEAVEKIYKDIDKKSLLVKNAALNAYFNIFNLINNDEYYNEKEILTRDQFYYSVYRGGYPVISIKDINNTDYYQYIKYESDYSELASQVEPYGFLKASNGSLNENNISQPITKLEAYYLVTNIYFSDYIDRVEFDNNTTGMGFKNAGNMIETYGFNSPGANKAVELNLLAYMSQHRDLGIDESILKVITTAERLGLNKNVGTDLFGPITKNQMINLLINVYETENTVRGFLTKEAYGVVKIPVYEYPDPVEYNEEDELNFNEPLILTENKIKFHGDSDKYVDEQAAIEVLQPVIVYMNKYPEFKLLLVGSTAGDSVGRNSINLSKARAEAVKNTLVQSGINEENIVTIGLGGGDPWHIPNAGTTGEDAAKNRKVVMLDYESEDTKHLLEIEAIQNNNS